MKPSLTTATPAHSRAHFAATSGETPLPLFVTPTAAITSPIASASSHS